MTVTTDVDAALHGLQRHVDIGVRLAPTEATAAVAAKSLAAILDEVPTVPVRLAGIGTEGSRVHLTLAVTLGTLDDVKAATEQARAAVVLLQRIVEDLAAYDPCLVELPDPESPEARLAAGTQLRPAVPVRRRAGEGLLALIG